MSSRRRPSLVASLHFEGPSHECGRETRFWSRWLTCRFMIPEVEAIWSSADGWLGRRPPGPMPQLEDGVRHGFKVSRFPDFWPFWGGGWMGILSKGLRDVPGFLKGGRVWSFLAPFFLHLLKKKTKKRKPYVPLGHQSGSALWLQLCNIWAS